LVFEKHTNKIMHEIEETVFNKNTLIVASNIAILNLNSMKWI